MTRLTTLKSRLTTSPITRIKIPVAPSYGQGRGGRPWRRLRDKIMERDGYVCQCENCKASKWPLPAHEVDHIVPISQGGKDNPENLRAINRDCHKLKTEKESRR